MALSGTKALEAWSKRITADYKNVNIVNMTTSWRSGLGFCAIIHHYYPHLIDYDSLDPDDVFGNNSLAFNVAEQQLGIPSLLDPEDMVECELLDRLSILTYLSQYFQVLTSHNPPVKNVSITTSASSSPVKHQADGERSAKTNRENYSENCRVCNKPVFILERLNVAGKLFHRTCFKCARCDEQLTLASFYETETGQFCCEVCPDEEDRERKRTLKARKDLSRLMAGDDDTEDENETQFDSVSNTSSVSAGGNILKTAPNNDDNKIEVEDDVSNLSDDKKEDSTEEIKPGVEEKPKEMVENNHENIEYNNNENTIVEEILDDEDEIIIAQSNTTDDCLEEENEYPEDNNPFGDDSEPEPSNEVDVTTEVNKEESVSANPFGSDFDSDEETQDDHSTTKNSNSLLPPSTVNVSQNPFGDDFSSEEENKPPPSPSPSAASSSFHQRKKRPAPLPPSRIVTPTPAPRTSINNAKDLKSKKDAANINRKKEILNRSETSKPDEVSPILQDKAEEGQWRRKKGPAPPRPLPPKRAVKKLARKAINQELFDIEVKQVGLERQGVKLEKSIREICAANDARENAERDSLGPEAEDLIIQLFDLVNEKNELFRRQTELIYMKKENRLEEVHADLEYQIRVLMAKPECQRTDDDKVAEEKLIAKLVEVVSQRNFIVDCLEMDRRRELDEDTAIEDHMSSYAAVKPEEKPQIALVKLLKRKKKKKKYKDDEKDIDTSELKGQEESSKQTKKSSKKKILSMTTKKLNSLNLTLKKQ